MVLFDGIAMICLYLGLLTLVAIWFVGAVIYFMDTIADMGGLRSGMAWYYMFFIILGSMLWPWDLYVSWGWRRADREKTKSED